MDSSATPRTFTVEVFGHTAVHTPHRTLRESDFTGVKPHQILELIALGRGEPVRKAAIAEHVWAARPLLCTTTGGYRLDIERVRLNLLEFDALIRHAAGAAPEHALPLWEAALRVAAGTLLAAEPYATWAVDARRAHEQVLHDVAVTGAETALALHLPEHAVPLARRATEIDPLAEHGWQVLIRAQLAAGRRAEAAHAFHTCRAGLRRDLGVEPDGRTRELLAGVLGDHPVDLEAVGPDHRARRLALPA